MVAGRAGAGKSALVGKLLADPAVDVEAGDPPAAGGAPPFRAFSARGRRFLAADPQGGGQDARELVAMALDSQAAIVVVDACDGVSPETHRLAYVLRQLGVRHFVVAVNKMDLVGHSREMFARVDADYRAYARRAGLPEAVCIPTSAPRGENVSACGGSPPWYDGPSLLDCLEKFAQEEDPSVRPFRMTVEEADADARACSGYVVSGHVRPGDRVRLLPAGRESRLAGISALGGDLPEAVAGQDVRIVLADEVRAGRGDVICASDDPVQSAAQFEASLVWIGASPLLPGRSYEMTVGTRTATATVAPLKYAVNMDTLEHVAATKLEEHEVGVCQLELDRLVAFESLDRNPGLGRFVLVDPLSSQPVGAGTIRFALRRAENVHWQATDIDRSARAAIKGHRPCVLWFTGISASGKSTIANLVEKRLHAMGRHTYLLDGDNVRHGLNKDLGFTEAARVENIRRIAEVARLMADAGLIVLTAFISPFRSERRMARSLLPPGEFIEVFVDTPLEVAEARDPKGLYRKARRGELKNFTGIDSPYERPESAEIVIDGARQSPEQSADHIVQALMEQGF
jgi:bifunctional enzyme CysN/CysC